jgi:uncharacterized protein YwgA
MGSTETNLTPRDAVLLALDAAGGTVEGRTAMQKILYFVSVALESDLGHRAHYYGPYSRLVEDALLQTAMADEVDETLERLPSLTSGPDIRKYTYELTESGRETVRDLQQEFSSDATTVKTTVEAVHEAVPDLDQQTLSMAAKIHFIVCNQQEPTPLAQIPTLARQLGWRISDPQVQGSVELLQRLDLLTVNS